MEDFREDKQMTLAQVYVCASMIRVCVRVSFVGEFKNEKKVLTEQKKIAYLLTKVYPLL